MIRHIEIDAVMNGFVVRVGCQTLVFDSVSALTDQLGRYLRNPEEIEKSYMSALNAGHTLNTGAVTPVCDPPGYSPFDRVGAAGGQAIVGREYSNSPIGRV